MFALSTTLMLLAATLSALATPLSLPQHSVSGLDVPDSPIGVEPRNPDPVQASVPHATGQSPSVLWMNPITHRFYAIAPVNRPLEMGMDSSDFKRDEPSVAPLTSTLSVGPSEPE